MLEVQIEKQLKHFNLSITFQSDSKRLAILGASGMGKSMLLKCIAGIECPDQGRIVLDGNVLFDSKEGINLPIQQRHVGYLFQDYALFPNMNVYKNLEVVAKENATLQEMEEYIHRFQIQEFLYQSISTLSGGQKQRVALVRILLSKPQILFLDEPFSALDSHLKMQLEEELLQMLDSYGGQTLFVSHSQKEVMHMSYDAMVLSYGVNGEIQSTKQLFHNPQSVAEAKMVGYENIMEIDAKHYAIKASDIAVVDTQQVTSIEVACVQIIQEASATLCIFKDCRQQLYRVYTQRKDIHVQQVYYLDILKKHQLTKQ